VVPEESRARDAERKRRWEAANKEKVQESKRRWYVANKEKQYAARRQNPEKKREQDQRRYRRDREKVLEANLRRKHGIRPEDVARTYEAQQGRCYLCGDLLPADRAKWPIDHDHRCCPQGKSCRYCRRGLTCPACNLLIGHALDNPERLRRIADNLEAAITDVTRRLADKAIQGELFKLGETDKAS
jgi:hypothetical protein